MSILSVCKQTSWAIAGLASISGPAAAATVGDAALPDSVRVGSTVLSLYNATIKEATFLGIDVYAVAIYLEDPTMPPGQVLESDQVKAVELTFLRSVKRAKLASAWMEDLKNSCSASCEDLLADAAALAKRLPDIEKGDRVTYQLLPDRVEVFINQDHLGTLEHETGPVSVLSAFIGADAPKKLRQALLREPER